MNEVLVRMEMPKSCDLCSCLDDNGDYPRCRITNEQRGYTFNIREKRMPGCPIICALPENHGRLIDADKIDYYEVERFGELHYMVWKPHIDGQPTIVPATETEATKCP